MEKDKAFRFIFVACIGLIVWGILTFYLISKGPTPEIRITICLICLLVFILPLSIGVLAWPNKKIGAGYRIFIILALSIMMVIPYIFKYTYNPILSGIHGGVLIAIALQLREIIDREYLLKIWNYLFKPVAIIFLICLSGFPILLLLPIFSYGIDTSYTIVILIFAGLYLLVVGALLIYGIRRMFRKK